MVEGLVNFARKNFFVPLSRSQSVEELNQTLLTSCIHYRNTRKVKGRVHTVAEAYAMEKCILRPITPYQYDTSRTATPTVGDYATVRFKLKDYSVPIRFLRKIVTVKGYANRAQIICDKDTVVVYERLFGQGKTSYRLEHCLDLLERKPRSVFQAKPVRKPCRSNSWR